MFISNRDARLLTTAFGRQDAPGILGIGGWIGSWELWQPPFSLLSAAWHTLAYDHRGSGATVAPLVSITFENQVEDVFAVMDAHGVERCVLAGESSGAAVVLGAALRHPERVKGLVLVDGFYRRTNPLADDPFLAALKTNYAATVEAFVRACVPEKDSEDIIRWGLQITGRATPAAGIALYESLDGVDLLPDLKRIHLPALVIHGEADAIVPVESSRVLAGALPDAELLVIPGAGHVPTMTFPGLLADAINRRFAA